METAGGYRRRWWVRSNAYLPVLTNLPGFGLQRLKGDLAGYWAIRVSAKRRILFRFADGEVSDVDLIDYH